MRTNYALGTRPTAQESGLGGLPIEADMRYTGGFMPYGAKEKADDVPARLSKNEFVFTADAVRAAGGGSINKGAKRMYNTMKQLESMGENGIMAEEVTQITRPSPIIEEAQKAYLTSLQDQVQTPLDTSQFAPSVVGKNCIRSSSTTTTSNTSRIRNITIW